ncbi:MAG: serine hydrolase [bacterium]
MPRIFYRAIVILTAGLAAATAADATGVFPVPSWTTATPASQGMDAAALQDVANLAGGSGMVIRGGRVVKSWGNPSSGGDWASAGKPVLSTLLLRAVDQDLTTLNATMGQYLTGGTAKDRSIRFLDLANMVSGYSRAEWPADAFAYNDYAINLYGYVLCEEVFGSSPPEVFSDQFGFLGFEDSIQISDWQYGRVKNMSVRDFARFGLFWLRRGEWNGVQVIPSSSFDLVEDEVPPTVPMTQADGAESWDFGTYGGGDDQTGIGPGHYAMNFWTNQSGLWPGLPSEVYQASGYFGSRVCWVLPDVDVVAVAFDCNTAFGGAAGLQALYDSIVSSSTPVPDGVETSTWGGTKNLFRGLNSGFSGDE